MTLCRCACGHPLLTNLQSPVASRHVVAENFFVCIIVEYNERRLTSVSWFLVKTVTTYSLYPMYSTVSSVPYVTHRTLCNPPYSLHPMYPTVPSVPHCKSNHTYETKLLPAKALCINNKCNLYTQMVLVFAVCSLVHSTAQCILHSNSCVQFSAQHSTVHIVQQ